MIAARVGVPAGKGLTLHATPVLPFGGPVVFYGTSIVNGHVELKSQGRSVPAYVITVVRGGHCWLAASLPQSTISSEDGHRRTVESNRGTL